MNVLSETKGGNVVVEMSVNELNLITGQSFPAGSFVDQMTADIVGKTFPISELFEGVVSLPNLNRSLSYIQSMFDQHSEDIGKLKPLVEQLTLTKE